LLKCYDGVEERLGIMWQELVLISFKAVIRNYPCLTEEKKTTINWNKNNRSVLRIESRNSTSCAVRRK